MKFHQPSIHGVVSVSARVSSKIGTGPSDRGYCLLDIIFTGKDRTQEAINVYIGESSEVTTGEDIATALEFERAINGAANSLVDRRSPGSTQ